jgi:adenine-specific DNA-methyltransferase
VPLQVRYMGTKREIAPAVARIIAEGPDGPLLDLFSGVCAIGSAVSPLRQVWSNDSQVFSSTVAKAVFTSPELPPSFDDTALEVRPFYKKNNVALEERFKKLLKNEKNALETCNVKALMELENVITHVGSNHKMNMEREILHSAPSSFPYRLFSITFAGGYFTLQQAIHIDSIRFGIDQLRETGRLSAAGHQWLLLALCQALSKVSTTTGHFAQYLSVKPASAKRYVAQRTRSVWREWLKALFELSPLGSKKWRKNNKVFRENASDLLNRLKHEKQKPSIVYADPPYSSDQYSRYYHVYETLILYDYPEAENKGRYRPDRFVSEFSLKTKVHGAMDRLISGCAQLGSALVLSYPERGLLPDATQLISSFVRNHFGEKPKVIRLDHLHSSMGASKGRDKYPVQELIFLVGM